MNIPIDTLPSPDSISEPHIKDAAFAYIEAQAAHVGLSKRLAQHERGKTHAERLDAEASAEAALGGPAEKKPRQHAQTWQADLEQLHHEHRTSTVVVEKRAQQLREALAAHGEEWAARLEADAEKLAAEYREALQQFEAIYARRDALARLRWRVNRSGGLLQYLPFVRAEVGEVDQLAHSSTEPGYIAIATILARLADLTPTAKPIPIKQQPRPNLKAWESPNADAARNERLRDERQRDQFGINSAA